MTGIFSNIANLLNLSSDQQQLPAGFVGPQQPAPPERPSISSQISKSYQKVSEQPGFNNALFKLGATLLAARENNMGLGQSLLAGQDAFNSQIAAVQTAKTQAAEEMLKRAQAIKALQPETSTLQKDFNAMGIDTNTPQGRQLMLQAILKPQSQVNVNNAMEPQFNKSYGEVSGKGFAETAQKIAEAGRLAPINIDQNKQLDALLSKIETGTGAKTGVEIKKGIKAIGLNPEDFGVTDNTGAADAAAALSNKLALELRNPAGGAGMPGAMSDSDREFLRSMTPNITMTKEGRKLALEWNNKIQQRNIEVSQLAREYKKANKGILDDGFDSVLVNYSAKRPLFSEDDTKKLQNISQPTSSNARAVTSGSLKPIGNNVFTWSPK